MSESAIKYRRLPGRRLRGYVLWIFVVISLIFPSFAALFGLWLGPDHLLSVRTVWFNEDYKRFYFRDIQSITIEQNQNALVWNYVLGVLAICICALFYAFSESAGPGGGTGFMVTGGIISGLFLLLLIISFLRGPSCICRIRTAVQTEELKALGRTHAAQRTLSIVKPLIEQAQGTLSVSQVASQAAVIPPPPNPRPAAPQSALPGASPVIGREGEGRYHAMLFTLMVLDALVGFFSHLHPHWRLYFTCSSILFLGVSGLSITALVRQRTAIMPDSLKSLTVGTFAWDFLVLATVFVYGFIARIAYSVEHEGQLPTHIDFYAMDGFKQASLVADVLELALGVAGLILVLMYFNNQGKTPDAPAPQEPAQPIV